ncbi:unnamed protein product [Mytilus edulis]|uniref:Uncharacterized protein n=1 Tax=Mytilus edulis TaxID=6550 RepID=A0A8S3QPK7_MYTED|nr:unnamed protein product [Mytilus edulis]
MGTSHASGNNKQPSEFIRDLKQVMEEVHAIVRENIQSAQFRQKRDYDTKLFERTYDVGDTVYRIDSATKSSKSYLHVHHDKLKPCEDRVLPKWLKYARHRLSLGVHKENEDLDIMIQDPDIGHDLSVLFPDEIPDNDLTMICSGSSGNYGQITNGSPVQDVDVNNQVMDTPGSIHSHVIYAEAIRVVSDLNDSFSESDLDETFLYGVEDSEENEYVVCIRGISLISRMASIERELKYDVGEEIELEGKRTVAIMGKERWRCWMKWGENKPKFDRTRTVFSQTFNRLNDYPILQVKKLKSKSVYSLHSLIHWKVLVIVISKLQSDQQHWLKTFEEYKSEAGISLGPLAIKLSGPISIADSHFHLDTLLVRTGCSGFHELSDFGTRDYYKTCMMFMVANFCFPSSWPNSSQRTELRKTPSVHFSFGIHPRTVNSSSPSNLHRHQTDLEYLVQSSRNVAIGDCRLVTSDRNVNLS